MNTLYLGYYDYPYSGEAYILYKGKFKKYAFLSDEEIDMLYYLYLAKGDPLSWSNYWPYSRDEIDKFLEKISAVFDDVIISNDGTFEHIKLYKEDNENA